MTKFYTGILFISPLHLSANSYVDLLIQEEPSLWISLFALAIVSMISLYLSSEQLKELDKKHTIILDKEKEIEKKQQFILEFMSGKIETSTKGIIQHRENFEKNLFEDKSPTFLKQEIEKFQESEALLLDATHELIDFLKIKSGTLKIKEESYKVSNVLNETFSRVYENFKATKTELIYDVSPELSPILLGDSKRIEQILFTLLDDAVVGTYNSAITLKLLLKLDKKNRLVIEIHNKNKVMLEEEIAALLENYTLKEEYKSQDKLYMYISYQLIIQMQGNFTISSTKGSGTIYRVELPYNPSLDIQNDTSAVKVYKDKRILLGLDNTYLSEIIRDRLSVQGMMIEIFDKDSIPTMSDYDVCIFDSELLDYKLLTKLEILAESDASSVFVLKNIYDDTLNKNEIQPYKVLSKPLQNNQILGMLKDVLPKKKEPISLTMETDVEKNISAEKILLKDTKGITRESFKQFSHLHILIVEDNSMNQKILKGVFSHSGMTISIANNGFEALEVVKNNSEFDLIFMDTNMPVMDGYEATKEIRKFRNMKMLPIVAIDSIGFADNTHDVSGINAFLHKPFKIGQLYTALMTYTSQGQSTVKNVGHKLTKYKPNKKVLDIQKGISHANTAIFYKEVLGEIFVTLNNSDEALEAYIIKVEYKGLKSFVLDTIRLSEIIGAVGLRRVLIEIMQTFDYKQENKLQDYIPLYKKELKLLKSEINEYLKT